MNKKAFTALTLGLALAGGAFAQKVQDLPEYSIPQSQTTKHMNILAADEMLGRKPGEAGNLIAGRYIAEQFRALGLKPANGDSYFQRVPLETVTPPLEGTISTSEGSAKIGADFVLMQGNGISGEYKTVHLPYAWIDKDKGYDDYKGVDVKGKVIITSVGVPDAEAPNQLYASIEDKQKLAKERGAVAIIEVFNSPRPWNMVIRNFGRTSTKMKRTESGEIPHLWISSTSAKILVANKINKVKLDVGARETRDVLTYNVAGILEGSDPALKGEYLVLSAHYDHVGHGAGAGNVSAGDTIFNGARDNAFGTVAVLTAAEAFTQLKPKRSILFIAYTAEEMGLLGSRYYAQHPLIPLNKTVFNMNCDGAGYNDITKITIIGLERTGVKEEFDTAARAFGLTAGDDPAPEQNLFDRSDNVSLAAKGIPAPTYSPGFTAFDAEISKYYHQAADNPDNIDQGYLLKYAQSYTYAARLIADRAKAPEWIKGDKYEQAYNKLFGK
ncbi:MAG: M28 family peptidase [Leadbetterella sp.]|nr:M28 family peptidase [Leadbetterella sp.]